MRYIWDSDESINLAFINTEMSSFLSLQNPQQTWIHENLPSIMLKIVNSSGDKLCKHMRINGCWEALSSRFTWLFKRVRFRSLVRALHAAELGDHSIFCTQWYQQNWITDFEKTDVVIHSSHISDTIYKFNVVPCLQQLYTTSRLMWCKFTTTSIEQLHYMFICDSFF